VSSKEVRLSTILWIVIIVVVLLALGYFARGRRR